jgi:hypothetical protein
VADNDLDVEAIRAAIFADKDILESEKQSALLEEYKLYVDTFEKLVVRRQTVHSFFISVNVFIATAAGFVARGRLAPSCGGYDRPLSVRNNPKSRVAQDPKLLRTTE